MSRSLNWIGRSKRWRAMQRMAYEIQRNKENEAHEREKLRLTIENEVLRSLLANKQIEEPKERE